MEGFLKTSRKVLMFAAVIALIAVCACTVDGSSLSMGAGVIALGMAVDTSALSNAIKKFQTDAGTLSTDSTTLDQKQKDASDAQAAATAQQNAVTSDMATLQSDLDAVNAEGAKLGLKINAPAPATTGGGAAGGAPAATGGAAPS